MSKRVIGFLVIGGLIAIFVYTLLQSSNTGEDPQVYQQRIEKERQQKNSEFRSAEDSPITEEERPNFQGLNYFPIDPALKMQARLERFPKEEFLQIATSTGTTEAYKRWGWAHFQIKNQSLKLLILQPTTGDTDYLFIPFADETSALSTYGAGRYLEVEEPKSNSNKIVLDFNQAYNPYCAYNERYTCPLPPKENLLSVAIEAGEKSYEK